MLEVRGVQVLDHKPISPDNFWAIYDEAIKAGDKCFAALLLVALNNASYSGEVASIKWSEIDFQSGGFVSRRPKTGISRIAMLWPAALDALKVLPKEDDQVFVTPAGRCYKVVAVRERFNLYRAAAGVEKDVLFAAIRDAAHSVAMHGADFAKSELLLGHKLPGTADCYLRRNPQLVKVACEAISKAFDVAGHTGTIR